MSFIALLIVVRIALPYVIKNNAKGVLAEVPRYYGQVKDIALNILRGAHVMKNLYLNKIDAGSDVPFLELGKQIFPSRGAALLDGNVVSEVLSNSKMLKKLQKI